MSIFRHVKSHDNVLDVKTYDSKSLLNKNLWTRRDGMSLEHLKIISYITDMSRQMNVMAADADSPFLAFLLAMVTKEGQTILKNAKSKQENH